MKKLFKNIFDIVFPQECLSCWIKWEYLCKECRKELHPHAEICPNCHKNSPEYKLCMECKINFKNQFVYEWIIIWFKYQEVLKKIILKLKYYHKKNFSEFLADRLKYLVLTHPEIKDKKNIILTSIPSHWYRKFFVKWYNQSEILCNDLGKILNIPYYKICKKIKNTKSQTELKRIQRLDNLKWSYKILENINLKWDETIVVVDDIVTTGSTINEMAKTIKQKFPKIKIWWLAVWRH